MAQQNTSTAHQIPEIGFLTLYQIIGNRKATPPTPPIIPVSRTTFLDGVKSGIFPKPVKLGGRTNAWKVDEIKSYINSIGATQ